MLPYLVPEFDEREAAAAAGVAWPRWDRLSRGERVGMVAWHRARRLLEVHGSDAAAQWAEARRGR